MTKFFILGAIGVLVAGIAMGQFGKNETLRTLGRTIVFIYMLIMVALIIGCIGIMIRAPHGSNSGFLMFPAAFFAFIAWILWGIWDAAREWNQIADKSDAEKLAWLEEKSEEVSKKIREELERDRAEVGKFWISPARRRKLRQRIGENEFLLKHAETMDDRYRKHIEQKVAEP